MALEVPFTHTFEYIVGDGGQYIKGLIEFNVDGKVSYKIEETSIPLSKESLEHFNEVSELLKKIFHSVGGIKKI